MDSRFDPSPEQRPPFALSRSIWRRFQKENLAQVGAALAFTTLLALVPTATVVLGVLAALPMFDILMAKLDALMFNQFLPVRGGDAISSYVLKFAGKARRLTPVGVALLGITAFLLLHTIERVFNHLWRVQRPRPLLHRLRLYLVAIVVVPFAFGIVGAFLSYAVTVSAGLLDEPQWVRRMMFKGAGLVVLGLFFSFLYYAVPNAVVHRRDAILGGVVATLGFALVQKAFELFLMSQTLYATIYGAFAALPIFLLWLYLCWIVVLGGGLLVATLPELRRRQWIRW